MVYLSAKALLAFRYVANRLSPPVLAPLANRQDQSRRLLYLPGFLRLAPGMRRRHRRLQIKLQH
jgi:hypothetical protein